MPTRITIALCTKDGATYLQAQLNSFLEQSFENWDLWVSDDGSNDETLSILNAFKAAHGTGRDIRILAGPQKGVAQNFLSLLCHPEFPRQAVALSDQDDVWFKDKLSHGLSHILTPDPCLFGAQSIFTDADLTPIGRSSGLCTPSFNNAISQNIISGHTAMLNEAALEIIRAAGVPEHVPFHDWWIYQLMTGAGARVTISPKRVMYYRQHKSNVIGANQTIASKLRRFKYIYNNTYGDWLARNTQALIQRAPLLEEPARALLKDITTTPRKFGCRRLKKFMTHKIIHQKSLYTQIIYSAVFLGRV